MYILPSQDNFEFVVCCSRFVGDAVPAIMVSVFLFIIPVTLRTTKSDLTPGELKSNETPVTPESNETPKTLKSDESPKTLDSVETSKTLESDETPKAQKSDETPKTPESDETPKSQEQDGISQFNWKSLNFFASSRSHIMHLGANRYCGYSYGLGHPE